MTDVDEHKYQSTNLSENEQKECTEDKNQKNEQQLSKKVGETEKMNEELAKQLKELTKQLDMYENERKGLREADKEKLETFKQLLEKEHLRDEELKKEIAQLRNQVKLACEKQATQQKDLEAKQEVEDVEKLKKLYNEELNAREVMYEEKLNKIIDQFNRQLKDCKEAHRKELDNLQLKVEELKKEEAKKLEDSEVAHRKELYDLQLKVELEGGKVKKLEENNEIHRKELNNLRLKVEELKKVELEGEKVKKLEENDEMHRKELDNLRLKLEEFQREKVKKIQENDEIHRKELNNFRLRVEELKKVELKAEKVKKLEENDEIHRKELDNLRLKLEELKKTREEKSMKETYYLTQMTEKDEVKLEHFKEQKVLTEVLKKEIEKLKKEFETLKRENKELTKQLTLTNKTLVTKEDVVSKFQDHEKSCNREFIGKFEMLENKGREENKTIYKKISDIQREFDQQMYYLKQQLETHRRYENINPETDHEFNTPDKNREEKFIHKQHSDRLQQDINDSNIVVEKPSESYLSIDDQEKQNVTMKLKLMKQNIEMSNLVHIDLPNLSRRVTVKFGDIVQEEVDIIVSDAGSTLMYDGGVTAAIKKASGGAVQKESRTKKVNTVKLIHTGDDSLTTIAKGALKCKYIVCADGVTFQRKVQTECDLLLKEICVNVMNVAQKFEATSIAFPPISPSTSGVSTELVASVMLSTLCGYKCSNLALLNDVRIVIIDRSILKTFINVYCREQQNLLSGEIHTNSGSFTPLPPPPPGFLLKKPDHIRYSSYSRALTQQHEETECSSSSGQLKPSPPDTPAHPNNQSNSKIIVDNRRKITGNQPLGGSMITTRKPKLKLCGYEKYGTIQINYHIPGGVQSNEHPNPGKHFNGISETAYLPDSPEGRKVVELLKKAFNAQLIFTVGTSHTSGATNAIVWNDIHHKTSTHGGPSKLVVTYN